MFFEDKIKSGKLFDWGAKAGRGNAAGRGANR